MISIQEIRIGNWILSPDGKPFQVYAETFADIEQLGINFMPIQLTDDLIMKHCGFTFIRDRNRYGWYLNLTQNSRYLNWSYGEIGLEDNEAAELLYIQCVYLHQLQNIYYSLTGQELTINNL